MYNNYILLTIDYLLKFILDLIKIILSNPSFVKWVPQTTKLRFVLLVLELFVLNCLMNLLIEEDFDKPVTK